jgi:hypothetical protein
MRFEPTTPYAGPARALVAVLGLALAAAAFAQPLAGSYQGVSDAGPTTVVLEQSGPSLAGSVEAPGLRFALEGEARDGSGFGLVTTGQGTAGFEAYVEGDTLGLYLYELDASGLPVPATVIELILQRVAASPAVPALGALRASPTPASPVVARGDHAELSEDAALAFIEALEFVLAEIGAPYVFPEAERRAAVSSLAAAYPQASREEQLLLADARAVWDRVRANWSGADLEARQEFALGVLALAYGEAAVEQWVGSSSAAGAGGGTGAGAGACATFEDCAGAYVDGQTWTDTFNAQGCWAAAGCNGYDVSTGTFDYGDGY